MSLEELIYDSVRKGLTHLTLYPVPSEDGKKLYWRAQATPSTGHAYVFASSEDPIAALEQALKELPAAKKRSGVVDHKPRFDSANPPLSELPQRSDPDEVTAAAAGANDDEWSKFR